MLFCYVVLLLFKCFIIPRSASILLFRQCSTSVPMFRRCSASVLVFHRCSVFRSSVFRCSWFYSMPFLGEPLNQFRNFQQFFHLMHISYREKLEMVTFHLQSNKRKNEKVSLKLKYFGSSTLLMLFYYVCHCNFDIFVSFIFIFVVSLYSEI